MIYLVTTQQQLFENDAYTLMTVQESLQMMDSWGVVQFDSETTGRDAHINKTLCIQFGNKKAGHQIVVDTTTVDIQNYKRILETKFIIGQNLKFDLQFLYSVNIIPLRVYDTMIVEQLIYLGYPPKDKPGGMGYALNAIAERHLGIDIDKTVRGEIIWRGLDTSVIVYAAGDVMYLEDIMAKQIVMCQERGCFIGAKLECDFVPVIAYLEWCGIKLDIKKWKERMFKNDIELSQKKDALDLLCISWGNEDFYKINRQGDLFTGYDTRPICTVNWSSDTQVKKVAKWLGFNVATIDKKTGEDKESVMEKFLKPQKGINDAFLKTYFSYQEFSKECSTYGQTYLNVINPITGRIHTTFRQIGTASGRMACGASKNFNSDLEKLKKLPKGSCPYVQLQNLPAGEEVRSSFIPNEGNVMCSSDYSALESRLGANIYNETAMIEEFINGSGDIHSLVAKGCFPNELVGIEIKDIKKKRPDLRNKAKAPEFACQFGGGWKAIMESLSCSKEEAVDIENGYYNLFQGIKKFKAEGSKWVRNNGYVLICEYTGHKMYWYDWEDWKDRGATFTSDFWDEYRIIKNKYLEKLAAWELNKVGPKPQKPSLMELVSMHFKAASKWDRMAG